MSSARSRWRLIEDGPAPGAWNMAVDEAILRRYEASRATLPPTLRLYGWNPPALSLGRNQRPEDWLESSLLERRGVELVRRPTGGRAVLHDQEQTYAVVGQTATMPFGTGVMTTYRAIAKALLLALDRLGVEARASSRGAGPPGAKEDASQTPSCFDRVSSHEITVRGRKLIGSAQLRRKGAFLQHGSLLLSGDRETLGELLGPTAAWGPWTDLRSAVPRDLSAHEVREALISGFAKAFGIRLDRARISARERADAEHLVVRKYAHAGWTFEGNLAGSAAPQRK